MKQTEFVCRIGLADIARRAAQLEVLVPHVLGRRREHHSFTVEVPASAEMQVRGFVAEESKCCPFFSYRIERGAKGLRLTVQTLPGGEAMLDALAAEFDPK